MLVFTCCSVSTTSIVSTNRLRSIANLHFQFSLTYKTPPVPSPDGEGIKGWGGSNTTIASTNRTDAMARLHNQSNLTKKTRPVRPPDAERDKGRGESHTTIDVTDRRGARRRTTKPPQQPL